MLKGNRVGTPNILGNTIETVNTSTLPWATADFVQENPPMIWAGDAPLLDNGARMDVWNGADYSLLANKCLYFGHGFQVERPQDGDTAAIEIIMGCKFITHGHLHICPVWALVDASQPPELTTFRDMEAISVPYQIGPPIQNGHDMQLDVRTGHLITQLLWTPADEETDWNLNHFVGWGVFNKTDAAQDIAAIEMHCAIRQLNNLQERRARNPQQQ